MQHKTASGLEGLYQGAGIIRTYSGKYINVTAPRAEDICIEDIAHALALTTRWGGHCPVFFSVAEHSVMMAQTAQRNGATAAQCLAVLLHDAAEAYLGDIPQPIKRVIPGFKELETALLQVIWQKYNLPSDKRTAVIITSLDKDQLEYEWCRFFGQDAKRHEGVWKPEWAECHFLDLYHQLSAMLPVVPTVAEIHAGMNC